jgi:hypothetical protein
MRRSIGIYHPLDKFSGGKGSRNSAFDHVSLMMEIGQFTSAYMLLIMIDLIEIQHSGIGNFGFSLLLKTQRSSQTILDFSFQFKGGILDNGLL